MIGHILDLALGLIEQAYGIAQKFFRDAYFDFHLRFKIDGSGSADGLAQGLPRRHVAAGNCRKAFRAPDARNCNPHVANRPASRGPRLRGHG